MRRIAHVFFFILAAFLLLSVRVNAKDGEEISSFAADYLVRADGTVGVTERIEYFFPSPRHGIFRDIPTAYVTPEGGKFSIPLTVVSVTDGSGRSWEYRVSRNSAGIRVKIGDPDVKISGTQRYVIEYEAVGALRYFSDHDEFYWNVTGNEWQVPIRRVAAVVRLPSSVPTAEMRLACFTGAAGSTARDCLHNAQGTSAHFAANEPVTIVVGWPHGLVARLEPSTVNPYFPFLPYLSPLFAVVALVVLWRKMRSAGIRADAENRLPRFSSR